MAQSGIATALGLRGKSPNSLKVPPAPNVDSTKAAADAIAGNLKNLPDIEELAGKTNEATTRQYLAAMERLIPGFSNISSKIAENIQNQVSGKLPSDVTNLISRRAAEMGISRGTAGSEFNQYGELRDLGLTSLEVTNKGLDAATRWMAAVNQGSPTFNFGSMFVSPAQRIATEQFNEVNRFNAQFLRNQISMLPSNSDMAWGQVLDYVATWATTAASAGTSSMMGGGGGQQQPQQTQQPYNSGEMFDIYNRSGPGY